MTFGTPIALLGLLVIPAIVVLLIVGERRRKAQGAEFGTPALVAASAPAPRRIRRLLPFALALVALAALIVGVARPRATLSVAGREATVILALDTSRSMTATDVKPSRLAAAVAAARTFLDVAPDGYSIGIVAFSTRATVVLSPTTDRDAARTALDQITLGSGTALGDAIDRSVAAARPGLTADQPTPKDAPPATVVLLSDGRDEDNPGTGPGSARTQDDVFAALEDTDAVIYPIGLGPRVDRALLQQLAARSGGQAYFPEDVSSLRDDYARVIESLRRRYVVSYTSTNTKRDGGWRAVQINIRQPETTVRSRGGYVAPEQ